MHFKSIAGIIIGMFLGSVPALADGMAPMAHNGSVVLMTEEKGRVEIKYATPRSGLSVKEGTVLFTGSLNDRGEYTGTAYTFKKDCPPAPYLVTGKVTDRGIALMGNAPRRDPKSCDIVPGAANQSASQLVFEYEPD
jgi:hypothetical protein